MSNENAWGKLTKSQRKKANYKHFMQHAEGKHTGKFGRKLVRNAIKKRLWNDRNTKN
jgi:hypothetical protein